MGLTAVLAASLAAGSLATGCSNDIETTATSDETGLDSSAGDDATDSATGDEGTSSTSSTESDAGSASGSDSGSVDLCAANSEPAVELGYGEQGFEAFGRRATELIAGVQGGYHTLMGVRGRHLDDSGPSVVRMTATIDGIQLAFSAPYADLVCTPSGQEAVGLLLIWDGDPGVLDGKTAQIRVEVTDATGTVVSNEGSVRIDATGL